MPRGGKREGAGPKPRRLIIEIEGESITAIEAHSPYEIYVRLTDTTFITIMVSSGGPKIKAALDKMRGARAKKE